MAKCLSSRRCEIPRLTERFHIYVNEALFLQYRANESVASPNTGGITEKMIHTIRTESD